MKRCPKCRRNYHDDSLSYCLDDGGVLVDGPPSMDEPATAILGKITEPQTKILPAGDMANSQVISRPQLASLRNSVIAVISIVVVALLGAAVYFYFVRGSNKQIESIAVMPFVNESGNTDTEYLSDGMTETLISSLAQLPNLSVKARSSVFRYKGKETNAQTIGKELNVQAILNGTVVQRGSDLALHIELVDAATENALWSADYKQPLTNLLSLQSDIARDVSQKLKAKLSTADEQKLVTSNTKNPEAYQLYLKGRFFWNKFTPLDLQKAAEYFDQALALDPNYALAYAGLADTYGASATNGWLPPDDGYRKGKAAARKAVEIDGTLAPAHVSLGAMSMFSDYDWETAEREYKHAIELDPNYELTYELYSYLLSALGRSDEALRMAQRGLEIDPLSATLSDDVAWAYYLTHRYDQSIEQLRRTLEMESDRAEAHVLLGNSYETKGMYEQAIVEYQKAIGLSERTSNALGFLGHAYAAAGKRNEALKILNEMKEASKQRYISPYDLAILYVGLGDKDKALEQLNNAYDQRAGWMIYLKVEPLFDPLRSDIRFQDLQRRVGLPN